MIGKPRYNTKTFNLDSLIKQNQQRQMQDEASLAKKVDNNFPDYRLMNGILRRCDKDRLGEE